MGTDAELPSPAGAPISRNEVQVWRACLPKWVQHQTALEALLTINELERANRFFSQRDRTNYVLSHGLLRHLLASQSGQPAAELAFDISTNGKPRLATPKAVELSFNISHSGDWLFIALAWERELGVDVERVRQDLEITAISRQYFTEAEAASIGRLPSEKQPEGFCECWVRKEAALKAWGTGLSMDLNRFDVSSATARRGSLHAPLGLPGAGREWLIRDLIAPPGYRAALVVHGGGWLLRESEWSGT